uniref:Structural maintenance of chromosomes protein 5 n=1 Tax=Amblyomma aureolatum TaxID=187763 RepID=A0A1E1XES8_9ACAR
MHQRLRELQQDCGGQEASLRAQQSQLSQERQKVDQLGPDMRSLQAYKEVQLRVSRLRQKLAWVEYEEARRAFLEEKRQLLEAEGQVQSQDKEVAQLKGRVDAVSRHDAQLSATDKQLGDAAAAHMRSVEASSKKLVELEEQFSSAKRELRRRLQEEEARASRMKADADSIANIEREMADLAPDKSEVERVQGDLQQCNQAIGRLHRERSEADAFIGDRQRESTAVVQHMKRLRDVSNQRMELLRRRSRDAYEAALWLRQNEGRFKGKVYAPIMTQIDVLDPSDAKYVEAQIPTKDLVAFVAERPDDLNAFLAAVRDTRNLSVNGVVVPSEGLDAFQPRRPLSQISQYGFRAYVRSLFTAPEGVMRYLCKRHRVHDIPVGSAATENFLAQVRSLGINRFFTKDNLYTVRVSQYDPSRTSTMSSELAPPSLLTMSVDAAALEELEQRKQALSDEIAAKVAEVKKLDTEERTLQKQLEELRRAKKRLQENAGRLRQLSVLREEKQAALQTMQNTAVDLEEERRKTTRQQHEICTRRTAQVKTHTEMIKLCCETRRARAEHRLDMVRAAADREKAESALHAAQKQRSMLQTSVEALQQRLVASQRQVQQKRREAQEATKCPSTTKQIPADIAKEFDSLPKTAKEINDQLLLEEETLGCMLPVDASVEREYQQRKAAVSRLQQEVAGSEQQLSQARTEMAETGARWQRDVEQLLQRVNTSFGRFFHELGCVGEVSLSRSPDPEQYDKYGVSIRVKFRDEAPLAELSTIHQSGGERSVATVLYMMALQEQTSVPFRVVDEINQGMDSDNERKVFEMMMNTAAKNCAQYLLLTPKLLPDLPYKEDVTMIFLTLLDSPIEEGDIDALAGSPVGLLRAA